MHLKNRRHTLVGLVGSGPMLDFDGRQMAQADTQERILKRGMRRFGPAPENAWQAALEAVNVISEKIGLERLMVFKQTRRPMHRQALENLLTKEMFPTPAQAVEQDLVLQEVQRLQSKRGFGARPTR